MNTVFSHLNNLIHYKSSANVEDDQSYNNYMINRWLSMYSPQLATIINYTSNYYYPVLSSKQDHHDFLRRVIPKSKIYRIAYIKKSKSKKKDDTRSIIKILAKKLELSEREIIYYVSTNNIDIERLKKICQ